MQGPFVYRSFMQLSHLFSLPKVHRNFLVAFALYAVAVSFIPATASAVNYELTATIAPTTSVLTFTDTPTNDAFAGGDYATTMFSRGQYIVKGTYPSVDSVLDDNPDIGTSTLSSMSGTNWEFAGFQGAGDYWLRIANNNSGDFGFVCATTTTGSDWSIIPCALVPPSTQTRIEWVNPPVQNPSATTTSRTIDFEFDYYLNSTTPSADLYTHILLQLYPLSYPNDPAQRVTVTSSVVQNSLENVSVEATTLRDGYYLGMVSFWNGEEEAEECNWWDFFGCQETQVIVGPTYKNNFNAATTTIAADAPPFLTETFASSCESLSLENVFDLDALLCNTLGYLFVPSFTAYEDLSQQFDQVLSNKIPFAYFYVANEKITMVTSGESLEETDITVSLGDPFGGSITMFSWEAGRNGIASFCDSTCSQVVIWGEWILFLVYVFLRVTRPSASAI